MKFFEKYNIIAFMSDKSMDFQPSDFDGPLDVRQREYLQKQCGFNGSYVFWRKQVHADTILVAEGTPHSCQGQPDADAYMTNQRHVPIAIRTADCVPVFLFDPSKNVIALAHAGWKGTYQHIAFKTVARMGEVYGCRPQDIRAALGPSIQKCCYQVTEEFLQYFPQDISQRGGKFFANVPGNNYAQLVTAGLRKEHITSTGICTFCGQGFHSFRRDGENSGRMISLMEIL